jgi:Transposase DDE domain group 1
VPFCQWTGVKALIAAQRQWAAVEPQISCFESRLKLKFWELDLRVVVYRKRVHHQSHRNYQLDLLDPNDGYCEYSAVATNLALTPQSLWYFMVGRGAQEKTFAELKGEFALDAVPTNHDGANCAWMQLAILAHNLMRGCQIDTKLAAEKSTSHKRTYAFVLSSMKTLRFTFINRAARVVNISGYRRLRFPPNPATQHLYTQVIQRLVA